MNISERFQALRERLQKTVGHAVSTAKLDFADQFDALLDANQLTRAELAAKLGKSRPFVSKVLRGDANPTLETMVELVYYAGGTFKFEITAPSAAVQPVRANDYMKLVASQNSQYPGTFSPAVCRNFPANNDALYAQAA